MTGGLRVLSPVEVAEGECSAATAGSDRSPAGGTSQGDISSLPTILTTLQAGMVWPDYTKNNNNRQAGRSEINTSSGGEGFSPLLNLSHRCSHF